MNVGYVVCTFCYFPYVYRSSRRMFVNRRCWLLLEFMLSLELQLLKQDEEQSLMCIRTKTANRAKASVESCQVNAYKIT